MSQIMSLTCLPFPLAQASVLPLSWLTSISTPCQSILDNELLLVYILLNLVWRSSLLERKLSLPLLTPHPFNLLHRLVVSLLQVLFVIEYHSFKLLLLQIFSLIARHLGLFQSLWRLLLLDIIFIWLGLLLDVLFSGAFAWVQGLQLRLSLHQSLIASD